MNIIKFGIACSLIFLNIILYSQNTFSKLYPLPPLRVSSMNSIVVTDTAYFVSGIVSDSIFPFRVGALFMKTDVEGNVEVAKPLIDTINRYETWNQSLKFDKAGNLVTNGYNFNNDSTIFFIVYDNMGKVLTYFNYQIIKFNFEVPFNYVINNSYNFVFITNSLSNSFQDKFISCVDNKGNKIWQERISVTNPNFTYPKLIKNTKGYLVGGWGSPSFPHKNTINQVELFQFDTLGNQIWEYKSPINEDWAGTLGGLEMSDDGDIVYASGKGTIMNPLEVSDYFTWDWCFTKLGFDKKIKWRTYFKQPRRDIDENGRRLWNMLKLRDNNGYISVGTTVTDKSYGWLVKVSEDGDSLWSRTYNLEDDSTTFYEIRQAKEDNEGNLVMVGERINYEPDLYSQQGWMMKLDKYGCLVPGCQIVGTKDLEFNDININIYPNPASEYIAFYINDLYKEFDYRIISSDGNTMKIGKKIKSEETAIINTQTWPSGIYHLSISKKGGQPTTKKIIIQH